MQVCLDNTPHQTDANNNNNIDYYYFYIGFESRYVRITHIRHQTDANNDYHNNNDQNNYYYYYYIGFEGRYVRITHTYSTRQMTMTSAHNLLHPW